MYKCFSSMPVRPEILQAIVKMGFATPTPIQEQAIAAMLTGRDIIGQAQTGTGKTAAFGIPLLQLLACRKSAVQALVLCPTRELAMQVADELERLGAFLEGLHVLAVYGGQPIERQIQALRRGVQIVTGTPGRVRDHLNRGTLRLQDVQVLVLDEADEMLNMGFREEVEAILAAVPDEAQRAFFSATMPEGIRKLCNRWLKAPEEIKIARPTLTVEAINQSYYLIRPYRKAEALVRLLEWESSSKALIFCSTRKMADELTLFTQSCGLAADALHGDLAQSQRDRVMARYRSGELKALIATDVAARGLDVDDVELVINFDLPFDCETYVHRVGRTGRAGRGGRAVSIISRREYPRLLQIMRFTKAEIQQARLPSGTELLRGKIREELNNLQAELQQGNNLEMFRQELQGMAQNNWQEISAALLRMLLARRPGLSGRLDACLDAARPDDLHEPFHTSRPRQPRRGGSTRPRFAELRPRSRPEELRQDLKTGKKPPRPQRREQTAGPFGAHSTKKYV